MIREYSKKYLSAALLVGEGTCLSLQSTSNMKLKGSFSVQEHSVFPSMHESLSNNESFRLLKILFPTMVKCRQKGKKKHF